MASMAKHRKWTDQQLDGQTLSAPGPNAYGEAANPWENETVTRDTQSSSKGLGAKYCPNSYARFPPITPQVISLPVRRKRETFISPFVISPWAESLGRPVSGSLGAEVTLFEGHICQVATAKLSNWGRKRQTAGRKLGLGLWVAADRRGESNGRKPITNPEFRSWSLGCPARKCGAGFPA